MSDDKEHMAIAAAPADECLFGHINTMVESDTPRGVHSTQSDHIYQQLAKLYSKPFFSF